MKKTENKTHSAKKKQKNIDKSFPISRREEFLRKKIDNLDYELSENQTKIVNQNREKFAKLQRKIAKSRARQEAKITRQENSKLFAKNKIIYNILLPFFAVGRFFRAIWNKIVKRERNIATKRPHRSFYLTARAATKRGIKMRGYFGFIYEVAELIGNNKWLFAKFVLLYSLLAAIIVGMLSQENFTALRETLEEVPNLGFFAKYSALVSGAMTDSGGAIDAGQQTMSILLFLYGWLTLIWLLRNILNNNDKKIKLRDGLYNGGASVLSTLVIIFIILLQLLPFALALLMYSSVTAVGWINTGIQIENMAAWCALAIIAILTLYWICSSIIALVIVTLPGAYPMQAMRAAGDLAVSRRVNIILRLIMMIIPVAIAWLILLLPAILLDGWLANIGVNWIPVVPLVALMLTTLTIVWCASYIYLLYRKIVDDPTPPVMSARQIEKAKRREEKSKKNRKTILPKFIRRNKD